MAHALETRVLLEGAEDPRLATLQGYKDIVGGYATLERAYKEMEQDQILKELEDSGLRGRGAPRQVPGAPPPRRRHPRRLSSYG